jgi:multicomponent Na+:H+ antiporter subunit E
MGESNNTPHHAAGNFVFRKPTILGVAVQAVALMSMWILLSGMLDAFHLSMGAVSVAFIIWINFRVHHVIITDSSLPTWEPIRVGRALRYVGWLAKEIVLAALQVVGIVLSRRPPVNPSILRFRTRYTNHVAKVILGNSITLTPGTLTLEIIGDEFVVHALSEGAFQSLIDGTMPTEVAKLFAKHPGEVVYDIRVSQSA